MLTHAGLTRQLCESLGGDVRGIMESAEKELAGADCDDELQLLRVGRSRGGGYPTGGILWCDHYEFEDIPGVSQVFGHTRGDAVRHGGSPGSEHYCIDTVLRHCAIHEGGAMRIVESQSL